MYFYHFIIYWNRPYSISRFHTMYAISSSLFIRAIVFWITLFSPNCKYFWRGSIYQRSIVLIFVSIWYRKCIFGILAHFLVIFNHFQLICFNSSRFVALTYAIEWHCILFLFSAFWTMRLKIDCYVLNHIFPTIFVVIDFLNHFQILKSAYFFY